MVSRALLFSVACLAVAWANFVFPIFWRQVPLENVAKHIIAGDPFSTETLKAVRATRISDGLSKESRTSVLSSIAVFNLRLLEQAVPGRGGMDLDALMKDVGASARQSLVNSPADPFLWTVLFWLENARNGFDRRNLNYLEMSYEVGPNEGWVAVKRNRFALAVYGSLTPALAENALNEFPKFLDPYFFAAAADILEGPGWPVRDALMARLKDVDEINRERFAKIIYRRGIDLVVPGINRPDWRPWR